MLNIGRFFILRKILKSGMLKCNLTLLLISFSLSLFSQLYHPKFSPGVLEELNNNEEFIEVQLLLKDQVDLIKYKQEAHQLRTPFKNRAGILIQQLVSTAEKSQADLLKILEYYKDLGEILEIKPYWIVNAIVVVAKKELLNELANHKDVAMIFEQDRASFDAAPASPVVPAAFAPNGTEPGLRAIKAPELWKMGYTGYGTKAYIIDSGQEHTHPAIRTQYAGNYLPFSQVWSGGFTEPFDVGGHGTHVTGTVCGLDRVRRDTIGVAFNAHWIGGPVQFSNSPQQPHPVGSFLSSMQFALNPDGDMSTTDDIPDVINNSWTNGNLFTCEVSRPFDFAIQALEVAGVAIVWSAGNSGPQPITLRGYQNINIDLLSGFAVGATGTFAPFNIADFSSRGPSACGGEGSLGIKPEVSAPGVNVRSAVLNNSYQNFNGTSMASPHVSGAVLLLKEAFPYLSGEDILMALYVTAIDLGDPGEDNDYGNGFIDVLAAFNYLVGEGFDPVPPVNAENDVILVDVSNSRDKICTGVHAMEILVFNNTNNDLTTLNVNYNFSGSNNISGTLEWTGYLPINDFTYITLDNIVLSNPGSTEYFIEISLPNGKVDERVFNNRWLRAVEVRDFPYMEASILDVEGGEWCNGSNILVLANEPSTSNSKNIWYDSNTGNTPLAIGDQVVIPFAEQISRIYLDRELEAKAGRSISEGDNVTFENLSDVGLVFDALADIYIRNVTINANNTGNMLVSIIRENGDEIGSYLIRIRELGIQKAPLNAFIPQGNNYKIVVKIPRRIAIAESGISYPYLVNGLVRIKRAEGLSQGTLLSRYPYFFDWEISAPYVCGRTGIDLFFNEEKDAPYVDFDYYHSTDSIIYTNELWTFESLTESDMVQYRWDFGTGEIFEEKELEKSFPTPAVYNVSLTVLDDQGCLNAEMKTLTVLDKSTNVVEIEKLSTEIKISLSPNPTKDLLTLKCEGLEANVSATATITDVNGKLLLTKVLNAVDLQRGLTIDLSDISSGLYTFTLNLQGELITQKFVKI